jgi:hypothetical protein
MEQPYPLPQAARIDFSFDATEIIALGDTISTADLTPSSNITTSSKAINGGYVTFNVQWVGTPNIGEVGYVNALITSTGGRILPKQMTFFATEFL